MPLEAVETFFECENCEKPFKSLQGLAFYAKVMHSIIPKEDRKTSEPPGMQSDAYLISLSVKDVAETRVKVVSTRAKSDGASKVAGKKRSQYSAALKAEAVNAHDNRANQQNIAESFGMTQSQISNGSKYGKLSSRMLHPLTGS